MTPRLRSLALLTVFARPLLGCSTCSVAYHPKAGAVLNRVQNQIAMEEELCNGDEANADWARSWRLYSTLSPSTAAAFSKAERQSAMEDALHNEAESNALHREASFNALHNEASSNADWARNWRLYNSALSSRTAAALSRAKRRAALRGANESLLSGANADWARNWRIYSGILHPGTALSRAEKRAALSEAIRNEALLSGSNTDWARKWRIYNTILHPGTAEKQIAMEDAIKNRALLAGSDADWARTWSIYNSALQRPLTIHEDPFMTELIHNIGTEHDITSKLDLLRGSSTINRPVIVPTLPRRDLVVSLLRHSPSKFICV